MRKMRSDGWSYRAIADEIMRDVIKSKTGDAWSAMVIGRLLKRQT